MSRQMNHPCGRCLSNVALIAVCCMLSLLMVTFLAAAKTFVQLRDHAPTGALENQGPARIIVNPPLTEPVSPGRR